MTPHNEAKIEDISNIVLMPGDPLRAKYIADTFLDDAKLVNTVRNMFGYTGFYKGKDWKIRRMVYHDEKRMRIIYSLPFEIREFI